MLREFARSGPIKARNKIQPFRQPRLWIVAALSTNSAAFLTPRLYSTAPPFFRYPHKSYCAHGSNPITVRSTRLYSSNSNNDGFLKRIAKQIPILKEYVQTDQEKALAMEKKQVQQGLDLLFKDAPFPVRMLGKAMGKIVSSVAGQVASQLQEQQASVTVVLEEARRCLVADATVRALLGDNLSVGLPFSQSSSSVSINGNVSNRVELAFPVTGPKGQGVAQLSSSNSEISSLTLQAGGRVIAVNVKPGSRSGGKFRASDENDIIEAEIIEKRNK
jgi:hypothetical protein